jgi:FixJ family two-component response regulator
MSSKEPQPAASSDDRSATVFVIDDDHGVRDSIRNLVWSIGLGVELFSSADEFLARGEWPRPACLVLDVRLPGQNGLEFQHYLTRAHVSIPIVFISGYADVPMSVRAMKAGAVEFIIKPVRPQDLLDAIQSAIAPGFLTSSGIHCGAPGKAFNAIRPRAGGLGPDRDWSRQ